MLVLIIMSHQELVQCSTASAATYSLLAARLCLMLMACMPRQGVCVCCKCLYGSLDTAAAHALLAVGVSYREG
jgi:hypothetical protein